MRFTAAFHFLRSFALALFCALSILVVKKSSAQSHNAEIYKKLIQTFLIEKNPPFTKIDERFKNWVPPFQVDTSATTSVRIGPPEIFYEKLENKKFTRKVEISVEIQASIRISEVLSYSDTLSSKELKLVQRNSPIDFRSELPTTSARIVTPLAIVGASISGLISLFYIRSR